MTIYTPAEIIQAGITDTRETFAHLYVHLAELRAQAAYLYHLAFVDHEPDCDQEGRLPFHPAPAGFGGNELAIPAGPVRLDRLTPAGLTLYIHGVRTAESEREELLHQIELAELDLERMHIAASGTLDQVVRGVVRGIEKQNRDAEEADRLPQGVEAWDVPVRIPGTNTTLPPR